MTSFRLVILVAAVVVLGAMPAFAQGAAEKGAAL